jgi:hypothetical protein
MATTERQGLISRLFSRTGDADREVSANKRPPLPQQAAGVPAVTLSALGGGTPSPLLQRLMATAFGRVLVLPRDADLCATLGAA